MKNIVKFYEEKFKSEHRKFRRTAALLMTLALVVAVGVFWQLHATGIAMTNETYCGLEEHQHDANCYEEVLVCGLEESEEHTHTDDCYETQFVCELEEHMHTAECMSDETADTETAEDWEASLPELTGVWADDMVAVSESQLGYTESTKNFTLADDGETRHGYTRYGEWAGNVYGDWDAMFVSFCLYYSGISMEDFPEATGAYAWSVLLQDEGLYVDAADYQPVTGDLVFLDTDEDDKIDRTGIVVQIDTEMDENEAEIITKLYVIEGDYAESEDENDAVCRIEYEIDDAGIIGYGVLPEQADAAEADTDAEIIVEADSENDEAEDGESEAEGDETEAVTVTLSCEGEDYIVTVVYGADAALPDGTELLVSEYASDSENWQNRYEEASELYGWDDDAYDFRLFDISLVADGEEVEPAAEVQVTISLSGKDELTEYTITHYGEDEAEEIEAVSDYADDTQTVSFETDGFSEYSLTSAANPNFTVQYYAWLDVVSTTGSTDVKLTVLDTSGGTLPTNSTRNKKIELDLAKTDSGDYVVATSEELTEVYSSASYDYTEAPGLEYVNKLAKNTGYEISQIWILKSGKSSDSTSESDWDIYTYTEGMDFTNNAASADEKTILIKNNSYIRIVYDTVDVTSDFKANLYDYDITDGKLYTSNSTSGGTTTSTSGTVYVNTVQQGINSAGNYSGTGTKLAFGNSNTGTGLGTLAVASLSGSTLNQYNRLGNSSGTYVDYGCTFGLVTGLSNGVIQYANGVSAPNLFDDGTATGKTTYTNQNLTFIKEGDTYTLTEVSGSGGVRATGLETFSHLTEYTDGVSGNINIYTNNFWPMDVVSHDNQDLLFGDAYSYANGLKKYIYSLTGANLPISDDSKAHNSYFGMQYSVDFTLTSDYVGPLNYYFFGDDDMWVFLTDSNGNSRLVCDIGGVHSSVGEYVNLWDYIDKGSSDTYTLTFYYTERGASGSTCYMRFTLPSVTSSTPVQDTGTLRVEKEVQADSSNDASFDFNLNLKDSSNNALTDTYAYNIHSEDGTLVSTGTITNNDTFSLKDGQYILVSGLPDGTQCTVSETTTGYVTSYTVDSGSKTTGTEASATIEKDETVTVHFINSITYELPSTGGFGTRMFGPIGLALCGSTGVLLNRCRKRYRV